MAFPIPSAAAWTSRLLAAHALVASVMAGVAPPGEFPRGGPWAATSFLWLCDVAEQTERAECAPAEPAATVPVPRTAPSPGTRVGPAPEAVPESRPVPLGRQHPPSLLRPWPTPPIGE
jgi:hypothetical protein